MGFISVFTFSLKDEMLKNVFTSLKTRTRGHGFQPNQRDFSSTSEKTFLTISAEKHYEWWWNFHPWKFSNRLLFVLYIWKYSLLNKQILLKLYD